MGNINMDLIKFTSTQSEIQHYRSSNNPRIKSRLQINSRESPILSFPFPSPSQINSTESPINTTEYSDEMTKHKLEMIQKKTYLTEITKAINNKIFKKNVGSHLVDIDFMRGLEDLNIKQLIEIDDVLKKRKSIEDCEHLDNKTKTVVLSIISPNNILMQYGVGFDFDSNNSSNSSTSRSGS